MPLGNWKVEDVRGNYIQFDLHKASWVGNTDDGIYYLVYEDLKDNCWRYLAAAGDDSRDDGIESVIALTGWQFASRDKAAEAARKRCEFWCSGKGIKVE